MDHRACVVVMLGLILLTLVTPAAHAQWSPQVSGVTNRLEAVWFTGPLNGWIVGDAGASLFTNDGGQSWFADNITQGDLGDVAFRDPVTGLMVGDNGMIFRTTDGGSVWTQVVSGTQSNLRGVAFGAGDLAYAVGRDGTILRSDDAGATWISAETGTARYRSVAARGSSAWVVGNEGAMRVTTDGGLNWTSPASGGPQDLHDVFFLSTTEGWITGQNNTLRYSNDGGVTWTSRNVGISVGPNAVYFLNSNDGWAASPQGFVFRTTDGGLTWFSEASLTTNDLNDIFLLDGGNGWAVGDLGTVLFRNDPTAIGDETQLPHNLALYDNYPNPFNPSTRIEFELPAGAGAVDLTVYDARGRLVRRLVRSFRPAGRHSLVWDGTDDYGTGVSSGVYVYRLRWNDQVVARRMTLVK